MGSWLFGVSWVMNWPLVGVYGGELMIIGCGGKVGFPVIYCERVSIVLVKCWSDLF